MQWKEHQRNGLSFQCQLFPPHSETSGSPFKLSGPQFLLRNNGGDNATAGVDYMKQCLKRGGYPVRMTRVFPASLGFPGCSTKVLYPSNPSAPSHPSLGKWDHWSPSKPIQVSYFLSSYGAEE